MGVFDIKVVWKMNNKIKNQTTKQLNPKSINHYEKLISKCSTRPLDSIWVKIEIQLT